MSGNNITHISVYFCMHNILGLVSFLYNWAINSVHVSCRLVFVRFLFSRIGGRCYCIDRKMPKSAGTTTYFTFRLFCTSFSCGYWAVGIGLYTSILYDCINQHWFYNLLKQFFVYAKKFVGCSHFVFSNEKKRKTSGHRFAHRIIRQLYGKWHKKSRHMQRKWAQIILCMKHKKDPNSK